MADLYCATCGRASAPAATVQPVTPSFTYRAPGSPSAPAATPLALTVRPWFVAPPPNVTPESPAPASGWVPPPPNAPAALVAQQTPGMAPVVTPLATPAALAASSAHAPATPWWVWALVAVAIYELFFKE